MLNCFNVTMVNFTVTIVRHGITDANQDGTIQGQMDEPLNDLGRQQALLLGKHLNGQTLSHVFSSDLRRTKETADLILNNFLIRPSVILDERLRERNYGVLQGQPTSLLRDLAMKSNKNVLEYTAEGGENLQQLSARAISFFKDLCFSLSQQFPHSAPPTPRLLLCSSQRASRSSVTFGQYSKDVSDDPSSVDQTCNCKHGPGVAKFYLDDAVAAEFCSSQDSGISGIFSSEPLTVDTADTEYIVDCPSSATDFSNSTVENSSSNPVSPTLLEWPPVRSWSQTTTTTTTTPVVPPKLGGARNGRKVSMQSIASDDSNFPDIDAQVLVVSHGGTIREMLRYFVDELCVSTPGGKGAALRPCPNTGFSTFFVSIENNNFNDIAVTCLNLHAKDHLLHCPTMITGPGAINNDPV